DLAHSLKTPLAVLKADLPDDPQVASMERIIARRLSAAATAGPGQLSGTPIATVIDEILRGLGRVYADRRLEFRNEAPRSALAAVEREDLEESAGSLLDNACKFARRTVRVALEPTGPGRGRLVVEDDGAGMSAEQAALAVDRGQRFDPAARGSGLGLAIV